MLTVEYTFTYNTSRVEQVLNQQIKQKRLYKEVKMSKNEFICDCNVIHQDVVNNIFYLQDLSNMSNFKI